MNEIPPTQNLTFGLQALPDLFHADAEQFILLLSREGNKFLQFYWDEAGKKLNQDGKVVPFGLNHEILPAGRERIIVLITMPRPVMGGEILYLALMYRPDRVMLFGFLPDFTRVLALIQTGRVGGELVEVTRRLEKITIRKNIPFSKDVFLTEVKQEMD